MTNPNDTSNNGQRLDSREVDQVVPFYSSVEVGRIRLGCVHCDRSDFDGVIELPTDWLNVTEVQSYESSIQPVDATDEGRSALDWSTHLGVCPACSDQQEDSSASEVKASRQVDVSEEEELISVHPIVRQIIDRDCHVGCSHSEVIRHVVSKLKGGFESFRNMKLEDRELLIDQCMQQHSANRKLYVEVMSGLQRTSVQKTTRTLPTALSGSDVISLMRRYKVTIKELARRIGVTLDRIRKIRERGLQDPLAVRDWIQAISGEDPGPIPSAVRIGSASDKQECAFCGYPFHPGDSAWKYVEEVFCSVNCCRKSRNWP